MQTKEQHEAKAEPLFNNVQRTAEAKLLKVARLNRVFKRRDLTKVEQDAIRPFRIWDEGNFVNLPHRCYVHEDRAKLGALIACKFAKVGDTFQVYDARSGRSVCSYRRGVSSIIILKD
jgi:hypothetical protein